MTWPCERRKAHNEPPPQNANVEVISAFACIGLDRTGVEFVADPAATATAISARGIFGRLDIAMRPALALNPKSSEMTTLGFVRLIESGIRTLVR